MEIIVVSQDEMQKLREAQERHELEELRAALRLESLEDARKRFEIVTLATETMLHVAEEAYMQFDDDDFDDFETAKAKADKLEKVEREHDRTIAAWENQLRRLNWESRNAQKTL